MSQHNVTGYVPPSFQHWSPYYREKKQEENRGGPALLPFVTGFFLGCLTSLAFSFFDYVDWSWGIKASISIAAPIAAFGASVRKSFLTYWDQAETKYTKVEVDHQKSTCDGIIAYAAVIAIWTGISGVVLGHKMSLDVEKLKKENEFIMPRLCFLVANTKEACPKEVYTGSDKTAPSSKGIHILPKKKE